VRGALTAHLAGQPARDDEPHMTALLAPSSRTGLMAAASVRHCTAAAAVAGHTPSADSPVDDPAGIPLVGAADSSADLFAPLALSDSGLPHSAI
jgi:hypothetical protein